MFNFNLKDTKINKAILLERVLFFKYSLPLARLFLVVSLVLLILFLYGFLPENFTKNTCKHILGFLMISLDISVFFFLLSFFYEKRLKFPKIDFSIKKATIHPSRYNLAEFLDFNSAKIIKNAIKLSKPGKTHSLHILYSLLKSNTPLVKFVFDRLLINLERFKQETLKEVDSIFTSSQKSFRQKKRNNFSEDFKATILGSLEEAVERDHSRIEVGDILIALSKTDEYFKEFLLLNNIEVQDIKNLVGWFERFTKISEEKKRFWEYKNLLKKGTLARQWTAGYTVTLDRFSLDLTEFVRKKDVKLIGHEQEISEIEKILAQEKTNNVLIVGEPGTGKKSIVYALARKSFLGESLDEVNYQRFVELDLSGLISQIQDIEEIEAVLDRIFQEVIKAGNVILVIDNLQNYVGPAVKEKRAGVVDISSIMSFYLQLKDFRVIALTDYAGLHKNIESKPSFSALFEKVEVREISPEETFLLLQYLTLNYEKKYKVFISYQALKKIIEFSDRYLSSLPFPEKAIDVLDASVVYAESRKESVLLPRHIATIITEKTEIPVGKIRMEEKTLLLNLEEIIHKRIINQEEAVKDIAVSLRRARSQVTIRKGPIGAFLFLGPTGVGKTETAKALAEAYFGSEDEMIRLDMSEFQTSKDIPKLIGSSQQEGLLTTQVRENPFSLVLLDEIEKSHSNILNLFLQVLDEGYIRDGLGRKVDFRNTIIIATSNAGYKVILWALKKNLEWQSIKAKLLDYLFEKRIFRPEFINRFDSFVVFRPLTKQNLLDIAQLMLERLSEVLMKKGIEFIITEPLKEKIVALGYNPVFGAREMRRVIQNNVENALASALLSGKLKRGDKVAVDPEGFKLIINPKKVEQ